ncbi:MAG: hypothetical protein N2V75_05960 [Methanophagales archaeon]|nr:hypothetical protein [Methanophagales archaeon]
MRENFASTLKVYDKTKRIVRPPYFNKIKYIFLDHDKTMTYKKSKEEPLLSKFLHPWAAKALENCLEKGFGIAICSTAHITRLIRQYNSNITDEEALNCLLLIGEEGSVFAIPRKGKRYDIYIKEIPADLIFVAKLLETAVDEYRETTSFDVFVNKDLKNHITIENFERKKEVRDELYELTLKILKENALLEKFWIKKGTDSIEINITTFDKGQIAEMFDGILQKEGVILAIGDSESDVPLFKSCCGIQIPPKDFTIDEINPLEGTQFIAIGSEGGGTTAAQLLYHILYHEQVVDIDSTWLKNTVANELARRNYNYTGEINAEDIKTDYTLPIGISEKYKRLWDYYEVKLEEMYAKHNLLSGIIRHRGENC